MSFRERADAALRLAGDFEVDDFYPAPFPDHVPTVELERISLCKLINGDEVEAERVFRICATTGFFQLDMLDHATGRRMWRNACHVHELGRHCLAAVPLEEKYKFKPLKGVRVFDRGYLVRTADRDDQPAEREIVNIPQSELFGTKVEGGAIPPWLDQDRDIYEETLQDANTIARTILSVLERQIGLPTGSFANLHRLTDDSGDFIRILRYPGVEHDRDDGPDGFPAHKDAVSVAILFTWLGGLQIPDFHATPQGLSVAKEDWRWVRPEPGYAVINLGDAMEIFTNKILKSGIHRVIKAPGSQRRHDRYSVLLVARPENNTPMKAFENPAIPPSDQREKTMTSLEWGHSVIVDIRKKVQDEANVRGTSILANA